MRNVGETEHDQREAEAVLKEHRRQRNEVQLAISHREEARDRVVTMPNAEEVRSLLDELGTILMSAAASEYGSEASEVRAIIETLTGGRIDLEQQGKRELHQGWLRGRFWIRLLPYLVKRAGGVELREFDADGAEVVIDYFAPTKPEELADEAKRLEDQDLLQHEIATAMGISSKLVGKALNAWYARHGQERLDGRARRIGLSRKQAQPPRYKRLADEVKRLRDSGLGPKEVAERLGCDRNMEFKAWNYAHTSRQLVPPTSRKFGKLQNAMASSAPTEIPSL